MHVYINVPIIVSLQSTLLNVDGKSEVLPFKFYLNIILCLMSLLPNTQRTTKMYSLQGVLYFLLCKSIVVHSIPLKNQQ